MGKHLIKLGFRNAPVHEIRTRGKNVFTGIYGNSIFVRPPVDEITFKTSLDELQEAIQGAAARWPGAIARRDRARGTVEDHLRKLADYVLMHWGDQPEIIVASGFSLKDTAKHAPTPPEKAAITKVRPGMSGQVVLTVKVIDNAKSYLVEAAPVAADGSIGEWEHHGNFTNSRSMAVGNLAPLTRYAFRVCAVGAAGNGDWSDFVIALCV